MADVGGSLCLLAADGPSAHFMDCHKSKCWLVYRMITEVYSQRGWWVACRQYAWSVSSYWRLLLCCAVIIMRWTRPPPSPSPSWPSAPCIPWACTAGKFCFRCVTSHTCVIFFTCDDDVWHVTLFFYFQTTPSHVIGQLDKLLREVRPSVDGCDCLLFVSWSLNVFVGFSGLYTGWSSWSQKWTFLDRWLWLIGM